LGSGQQGGARSNQLTQWGQQETVTTKKLTERFSQQRVKGFIKGLPKQRFQGFSEGFS